ncbi:protein SCO1 homolog 1, mitochondrial-like isoform X3 [Durio zibethinus]|uniref:Protein SCO1 homolog 1, mitochondrial-like isoform X3 n=1 Tax=Durio zibethinus TaxID=66656 RepID=A0A6P6ASE7_DURZI|nr:protein SCO1 homolog 1, mitochondrial-like isoform X3 [Durio zibethinus]
MATAIWRNASRFRNFRRCLYTHTLSQCRSSFPASSPMTDSLHPPSPPFLRPVIAVGADFKSLGICGRYLSNSTTAATDNQEKASFSSSKANSEGTQNAGGSQQNSGDAGKPVRGGPVSWLSFLLLLATGIGIILYYDKVKKRHIEEISNASKAVKEGPSAGKAAIGGPFSLINHDGKRVTEKDFLGKWTLVYFGFTHCPDICPDELQKLAAAIDKIKFHPKLVGLTGNSDEIKKVARAYRVYYMKTEEEDSDYLVDHSIVMYVLASLCLFALTCICSLFSMMFNANRQLTFVEYRDFGVL